MGLAYQLARLLEVSIGEGVHVVLLNSYVDESGKFLEQSIVTLCALVAPASQLESFHDAWDAVIRPYGMREFKMAKALRWTRPLGTRKTAIGLEARKSALLPFAECITLRCPTAVQVAVDAIAFRALSEEQQKKLGGDPFYLAFRRLMGELDRYFHERETRVALVCDEDQNTARACYDIFNRARSQHSQYRRKFASITFADGEYITPLQAADMLSGLTREEAERRFVGTKSKFQTVYEYITHPPNGPTPYFLGGFFGKDQLLDLARDASKP